MTKKHQTQNKLPAGSCDNIKHDSDGSWTRINLSTFTTTSVLKSFDHPDRFLSALLLVQKIGSHLGAGHLPYSVKKRHRYQH